MIWEKTVFDGLEGYSITSGNWELVVISECGPRIAFLGEKGGDNLLYWDKKGVIRGEYHLMGGHRVWISRPMADESEDTYLSDNAPCAVEIDGQTITVTSPAHAVHQLERGMRIEALSEGCFRVTNFVKNCGGLIYSGGVWSPTCIVPDGRVLRIPLGEDDTTWDIVKVIIPRVFAGNTIRLDDPQVTFEGNDMIVRPQGMVCKRCMSAPKGTIEMTWPEKGITFTKQVPYQRFANYPLDGCNLAVFVGQDNWMAEMESFAPEQPIIPGEKVEHSEMWRLAK